jgi:hypothetical protein
MNDQLSNHLFSQERMMNSTKPSRRPDIVVQDSGDETLLYSAEAEAIHVLNPTARRIWDLCDGQHTLAHIEQILRASFFIPADRDVAADIEQTLTLFAEKGLLQEAAVSELRLSSHELLA